MRARAGDNLVAGTGGIALIVDVLGADGHPPYIVKWLRGGNIAMVDPDPYARVIPADNPPRSVTFGRPDEAGVPRPATADRGEELSGAIGGRPRSAGPGPDSNAGPAML